MNRKDRAIMANGSDTSAVGLNANVGRVGTLYTGEGLRVSVTIGNARSVFGRLDYYVTPIAGSGSAWVSADRVAVS